MQREIKLILPALKTVNVEVRCVFVRCKVGGIGLRFYPNQGPTWVGITAGDYIRPPAVIGAYKNFAIENTNAFDTDATFIVGDGEFLSAATAGEYGLLVQRAISDAQPNWYDHVLYSRDVGIAYASSVNNQALQAAATALQLVAPGANTLGILVWAAAIQNCGAAGQNCQLLAKASAPAAAGDGDVILQGLGITNTGTGSAADLKRPIFVPAGKGLYAWNALLETGTANKHMLYTVL